MNDMTTKDEKLQNQTKICQGEVSKSVLKNKKYGFTISFLSFSLYTFFQCHEDKNP